MSQLVLTVNGPGEIAGWLAPVARVLKRRYAGVEVVAALLPCAFASGSELDLLRSSPDVDAVLSVSETLALIFRGRTPQHLTLSTPKVLIHMGGEPAWSWLLAQRLKVPRYAYVESPFLLQRLFRSVYFAGLNQIPAAKLPKNAMRIGDLVVDAAWMNQVTPTRQDAAAPVVRLYPGSREYLVTYILPFLAHVVDQVSERWPEIRWKLARAEFLPAEFLSQLPDVNDGRELAGQNLRWHPPTPEAPEALVTMGGNRIEIADDAQTSAETALAITIPGTMTAKLAALGVPMLVILPLVHSEKVPLPGPLNYVTILPVIGKRLKRWIGRRYLARIGFSAHPNRRANRMIVPELVGSLTPEQVAGEAIRLLRHPSDQIRQELRAIMGAPGAAERLVEDVAVQLGLPDRALPPTSARQSKAANAGPMGVAP